MIFNGRDLVSFCGRGVSINKEIPPATIGRSITSIGGGGGRIIGHVEQAPATYVARVNLHGASMADAWALKRKLAEWAYTTGLADLIPTHDPSKRYRAICREISEPEFVWGAATVTVTFFLPDPYLLDLETRLVSGTGQAKFIKAGSADPLMRISVTPQGSVTDPVIRLNGAVVFGVAGTVGAGVTIVVDFDQKTLLLGGVAANDRINFMVTEWHPEFQVNNTVTADSSYVVVEVVDRWL